MYIYIYIYIYIYTHTHTLIVYCVKPCYDHMMKAKGLVVFKYKAGLTEAVYYWVNYVLLGKRVDGNRITRSMLMFL